MSNSSVAFVFPGQGSQKVGMLAEMAAAYPVITETFAEASQALGYDVWDMVQNGEQEQLNLTERTQPILLTASVALWRCWQQKSDLKPALMAGHSLGEFSALVCAGSLQFADAVTLVRDRGQFMQTAVPVGEGAMAAVLGLNDDVILDICNSSSAAGVVEAVNFNSPGQVVIAGKVAAVEAAIAACKEAGAKRAMPLPVSAPFHTSLMKPAGEKLAEKIAGLTVLSPEIPVVHNVHAQTESDPAKIKELLVQQIYSPVKWVSCVETMVAAGIEQTVECGPGKVLGGLNRRIQKSLSAFALEDVAGFDKALAEL
ncbi:ACP S-malonyltransferase [Dasania sp. GY-MA-18]|uniref:Malonyl CoA-acyl carrier protein transacylase n=1 Tax=Dasania phycosphaerae TaxID=2950436 RepID=A0A9J6RI66_9GAMM|nr:MULTISPECIES: ACP S-malonyltransferase [Dasania]MCR8921946.1 ACP S-malonyltransferase [Dasania sp. GY-MA-18]MCZ0864374.1 ACP S-malonyltransferase [Dasania phycosphaerae]MCZ0868102.1 ACP S-malonyltransferase [Dasania phycosphaerae]